MLSTLLLCMVSEEVVIDAVVVHTLCNCTTTSTCDWESQLAVVFNDNHVLSTVGDTNCGIRLGNEEVFTDI